MSLYTGLDNYSEENKDLALIELVNSLYASKQGRYSKECFLERLASFGLTMVDPTQAQVEAANDGVFESQCDDFDALYAAICAGTWEPPVT